MKSLKSNSSICVNIVVSFGQEKQVENKKHIYGEANLWWENTIAVMI